MSATTTTRTDRYIVVGTCIYCGGEALATEAEELTFDGTEEFACERCAAIANHDYEALCSLCMVELHTSDSCYCVSCAIEAQEDR